MSPETPFRLAAGVIIVAAAGTSAYHRIQAAKSRERLSRRDEGWLFLMIRLGALPLFIGTLLYLVRPERMSWASLPLPAAIRWLGAAVGAATVLLLLWTLRTLGTNLTDTVVTRQHHTLITTGPYRYIRHPFYICLLLLSIAIGLLAANWFLTAAGILIFVLLAIRMPIEERMLAERFGDPYRDYQRSTGAFFPRISPPRP